jgi:hypothetical protein
MPVIDCEQGSPVWLKAREGRITASRIVDVLSYLKKGGESQKRIDYRLDLVAERLTGQAEEHVVSKEMKWGTETEPFARGAYEMHSGVMVDQVGFIVHPTMDYFGGSPDALVGADGVYEAKCPKTTTHLEWMMAGVLPTEHEPQCMTNIAVSEREWCDFMSYDPRLPEDLRKFIVRLYRDDKRIAEIEAEVKRFEESIQELIHKLRNHETLTDLLRRSAA